MGVFKDADQLYELLGGLFAELFKNKEIAGKCAASGLIVVFKYEDPDSEIWLDASKKDPDNIGITYGPPEGLTADVTMSMKADTAHQFWLGNVNLMVALTRKQIVAKGPIPKIMKLLPVVKPAYAMYQNMLKEKGLEDMIKKK